jgi:hypothetical protein
MLRSVADRPSLMGMLFAVQPFEVLRVDFDPAHHHVEDCLPDPDFESSGGTVLSA